MRRQTRPFIVEVKQKRNYQKSGRSIWGDVDFSAALADATMDEMHLSKDRHVDSSIVSNNADPLNQATSEHPMADPEKADSIEAATPGATKAGTPKTKTRRPRKTKAEATSPARRNGVKASSLPNGASAEAARAPRKIYSHTERAQKLAQIKASIDAGGSLKSAVKQVGISEQTYYQWKKAAPAARDSDGLQDLIALEEENKRLKTLLAEHLRKENAQLKSRLGLN